MSDEPAKPAPSEGGVVVPPPSGAPLNGAPTGDAPKAPELAATSPVESAPVAASIPTAQGDDAAADDSDDGRPPSRAAQWDADLRKRGRYTEVAALLAFLVPGLGHVYLGRPFKGLLAFTVLVGLFGWGIGISRGECVSLATDEENGHRYAFLAQVGAGLPTGLALLHTHTYEVKHALGMEAVKPDDVSLHYTDDEYVDRLPRLDEGLLYTMIAGLLNLLLIYDAFLGSPGAALRPKDDSLDESPAVDEAPTTSGQPPPAVPQPPSPSPPPEASPPASPKEGA